MSDSDLFGEVERIPDAFTDEGERGVPVDVVERDDAVLVHANLPGYDPEDVAVEVVDGDLEISAEREARVEGEVVTSERRRRHHRSVRLPAGIDTEGATAGYDRGVLTVEFPRTDGDGGTDIPVN